MQDLLNLKLMKKARKDLQDMDQFLLMKENPITVSQSWNYMVYLELLDLIDTLSMV